LRQSHNLDMAEDDKEISLEFTMVCEEKVVDGNTSDNCLVE
jgi:hypothetical protein